jgi:CRISPR/Cas system CSM-associated protein Csm2 small subunit
VNIEEQTLLLDNLQNLLEKQIEMARRSDYRRVEELVGQAETIVNQISKMKCLETAQFDGRRKQLTKLYKKLELILTADKDSVADQLQQVGNVRKTLAAYHNKS